MNPVGGKIKFGNEFLAELRDMNRSNIGGSQPENKKDQTKQSGPSFMDQLIDSTKQVDQMQKSADAMATDLATGKEANLHETMIAATQAELSFNLMVQVRNKALEAYQEIMRMQV